MVRSSVLGLCLAGVAATSAMPLGAWALSNAVKTPLHLGIAFAVWVVGIGCAFHFWLHSPVGELVWSGQSWSTEDLTGAQQSVSLVEITLDLQAFVWLRLHRPGLRSQWVWLQRSSASERWLDLRRAVYSRPKPGAPGAPYSA